MEETTTTTTEETKAVAPVTSEEALTSFIDTFGTKDWFHSAELDATTKTLTAYAKKMTPEMMAEVPQKHEDHRVLLAFAAYKEAGRTTQVSETKTAPSPVTTTVTKVVETAPVMSAKEVITSKLWSLKKICGREAVHTIFWELRDEENKEKPITSVSVEYPEVCKEMRQLYKTYSFDGLMPYIE